MEEDPSQLFPAIEKLRLHDDLALPDKAAGVNGSPSLLARQQFALVSRETRPETDANRPSGHAGQSRQNPVQGSLGGLPSREADVQTKTIGLAQPKVPVPGERNTIRSQI
jgi:hypothetical protein